MKSTFAGFCLVFFVCCLSHASATYVEYLPSKKVHVANYAQVDRANTYVYVTEAGVFWHPLTGVFDCNYDSCLARKTKLDGSGDFVIPALSFTFDCASKTEQLDGVKVDFDIRRESDDRVEATSQGFSFQEDQCASHMLDNEKHYRQEQTTVDVMFNH